VNDNEGFQPQRSDVRKQPLASALAESSTRSEHDGSSDELLETALDGGPIELTAALRVAVGIASALRRLHARGLVHRDVKPANLRVDWRTGRAALVGMGQPPPPLTDGVDHPPHMVVGTLAYMAPEQTGRVNRAPDSRTDLYAFGITLYRMLTGTLPFMATEVMGWLHAHAAQPPLPPHQRTPSLPPQLSAIVLRLLEKSPDDRYQTAAGVEADLKRCLASWTSSGRVPPFALGARDRSSRLNSPRKLYGRDAELAHLSDALERVLSTGESACVLVSGYSGIGKSALVGALRATRFPPHAIFAAGKLERLESDIPFAPLRHAFGDLVRWILSRPAAELEALRARLTQAVQPNGALLTQLVPELSRVIGPQAPVPELAGKDAENRLNDVVRRFIAVVATREHPLVLFLDDLHWLDSATLTVVEHLLVQGESKYLLLLGAYRDADSASDRLVQLLERSKSALVPVSRVPLRQLEPAAFSDLIADALGTSPERVGLLARLVHAKTAGNPFFATQFLGLLEERSLLAIDDETRVWHWDLAQIRAQNFTDNILDLMLQRFSHLPSVTLDVLKELSCFGHRTTTRNLSLTLAVEEGVVHDCLAEAVRSGLVFQSKDTYSFLHDRVQEASYALLGADRARAHLRIARRLEASVPEPESDVFTLAFHYNAGASLLESVEQRQALAELNLAAGRRARASGAHASALVFFRVADGLLDAERWQRCPQLSFAIELGCAECEMLGGVFDAAERRLSYLASVVHEPIASAAIVCAQTQLYTATARAPQAAALSVAYLQGVGVAIALGPTRADVERAYRELWLRIGPRTIESLVDLPPMTSPLWRAVLDVLTGLSLAAYFYDKQLFAVALSHSVALSLQHGNSDGSAFAYSLIGVVLGPSFGRYADGYGFGRLSLALVEEKNLVRFAARSLLNFAFSVLPYTRPLADCPAVVDRGFEAALRAGDLNYASYASVSRVSSRLDCAAPLSRVEAEADENLGFAHRSGHAFVVASVSVERAFARMMSGKLPTFGCLDDAEFAEADMEERIRSVPLPNTAPWFWVRKLQARFHAERYQEAVEAAERARGTFWAAPLFSIEIQFHFYSALAHAGACDSLTGEARAACVMTIETHRERLIRWRDDCPANFSSCVELVSAELARIDGRVTDAELAFEHAARFARESGLVHYEAIARERAALFYAARGLDSIANWSLQAACDCYASWGAAGKVQQLEARHPDRCRVARVTPAPGQTVETPLEQLDLSSIVTALQAISSEIDLERLVERLLKLAVQQGAADRGLLIFATGQPRIFASVTIRGDLIEVAHIDSPVSPRLLPETLLNYALRTEKTIVLDDVARPSAFSEDPFLRLGRVRSCVVVPIMLQGKMLGALYLENSLTAQAFPAKGLKVLDLLASQAAIALENARLYAELRRAKLCMSYAENLSLTGSFIWQPQAARIFWSDEVARIFDVEGEPSLDLLRERIHPDDRAQFEALVLDASPLVNAPHVVRAVMPDGTVKHLSAVAQRTETPGGELEYAGALRDITAAKRAEEELHGARAALAEVSRIASLGEVAAAIAHEVNQPLAALKLNASASLRWLAGERPNLEEARETAKRIARDASRAADVITRLRALFGRAAATIVPVDLNEAVREVLELSRFEIRRHDVHATSELAADLPLVPGDRVQLQQVLMNLISNAVEATREVQGRAREVVVSTSMLDARQVRIEVRDNGAGTSGADDSRIFEAFYTTKPTGMGMGLSICKTIVESHGGKLWMTRAEPSGTTFAFSLPIHTRARSAD